ncbi:hypothetical protein [uncultured Draconibacterium sp.]|uniref:hypothetical protein n=1 Tax=uncultured Draconibacterium sp. TaxID=1573823 RepID=UPI003216AC5D
MKYYYVLSTFVVLLIFGLKSSAQDRIILNSGDTLTCIISKESKSYIHFYQYFNGVSSKGKVEKAKVREWTYKTAANALEVENLKTVNAEETNTEPKQVQVQEKTKPTPDYGKIRASLSGGSGYLLGKTSEAEKNLQAMGISNSLSEEYYKNFKWGAQVKASLYFYLTKDYWLGAMYNGFYSNAEITSSMQMDETNMYYGALGERYFVNFAGLSLYSSSRVGKAQKLLVNSSYSIGPAFYRDEAEMYNEQVLIQGTTLGSNLTLGLEYFIQPKLSISFDTGLFLGKVSKISLKTSEGSNEVELDKENYENLSRLDLSFGIVYYW